MFHKISIFGGGSTGHAAAAYFTLKGFEVTLCDTPQFASRFQAIADNGGILLRGKERGFAPVHCVTHDFAAAAESADLLIISVVAYRHEEVARAIAPHIHDGQHILISPGNLGSFIFRKVFREMNVTADVTLSELEGNLFPARLTGAAEATVGMPFRAKSFSALPASDNQRVIDAYAGCIEMVPCVNVFDCVINSNNFVTHLGATILSACRIDQKGQNFNLFTDGLTPASIHLAELSSEERRRIISAMGYEEHSDPMIHMNRLLDPEHNPQLDVFLTLDGPYDTAHRYLTEDGPCAGAFAVSVARRLDVSVPLLESLVVIAGQLNGQDYLSTGRTLENLGYDESMSLPEIIAAL